MLSLKVLNSDATLNTFIDIGAYKLIKGEDASLVFQIFQPTKGIRYIPDSGAVITVDFLKNDNTTLTKTASQPFTDDRSIIEFDLTAAETMTIISQNLLVKIDQGGAITYAFLQGGLQLVSFSQGC